MIEMWAGAQWTIRMFIFIFFYIINTVIKIISSK